MQIRQLHLRTQSRFLANLRRAIGRLDKDGETIQRGAALALLEIQSSMPPRWLEKAIVPEGGEEAAEAATAAKKTNGVGCSPSRPVQFKGLAFIVQAHPALVYVLSEINASDGAKALQRSSRFSGAQQHQRTVRTWQGNH